jgi:hypothetical protein
VDDLVSVRLPGEDTPVIGRVTRRVSGSVAGQVKIGVHAMAGNYRSLTLSRTTPRGRPDDREAFIYVAGSDPSGAQDSFLVSEKTLHDPDSRDAVIGGRQFTIHFNRVRHKGRGWALVGFEVLTSTAIPGNGSC